MLYNISPLNWNFIPDKVRPAANTATPAFAFAIRSKQGSILGGNLIPSNTIITAKIGTQHTG